MATIIEKKDVLEFVVTGEFDIPFTVKSDIDSEESKAGTLRFRMEGVPLTDIISSSLKDKRINWQAMARKKFEQITGSIITVDYKGGRPPADPKQSTVSFLGAMSPEDRIKWLTEQGLV